SVFDPEHVVSGDFNNDGNLDLAVGTHFNSRVSIMLGVGDGSFPTHVEYTVGFSPLSLVAADVNGDGKLDLATADGGFTTGLLSLLINNGDGTFGNEMDFSTGAFSSFAVAAGDLDGNGSTDFVVTNRVPANVSVLLNTPVIAIAPHIIKFAETK